MNARARAIGLKSTTFVDTSGFDPRTVSTPSDLVRLGSIAIADPVVAEVVAQPQAELPVAGTVYNVDYAVGQGGIAGIKTGSSPEAGACFLFSSPQPGFTIVGAVMGLGSLDDAFAATKALIRAAAGAMQAVSVVTKDQAVGRYVSPWGSQTDILAGAPGNSCRLTASQLQPGTYQLTARFDGSRDFASSTSAPQTLTVKVPVRPEYQENGRRYPCDESVTLRVWCVHGRQEQGLLVCVLPTLVPFSVNATDIT